MYGMAFLVCGFLAMTPGGAQATPFHMLHSFLDGSDGASPDGPLIADSQGNLYGTALQGGSNNDGVVFEVTPRGKESVLYSFQGGSSDGNKPQAGLIADTAGNLYGTTYFGGPSDEGTVFKLAPDGTEAMLHAFSGATEGANPQAALVADFAGNLYGTTSDGGASNNGTVFRLAPKGALSVLHAFSGGSDGGFPQAALVADKRGSLYGTAATGGAHGQGTVFRISAKGGFKVVYSFAGGKDGADPIAPLIVDGKGNFYGTTRLGGGTGCFDGGCGTVFRLSPDGKEAVLYAFTGGSDGGEPYGGVVRDAKGNLYGATVTGGGGSGYGTAFKLARDGTFTVLHTFSGQSDGEYPNAGLIIGNDGRLYGTSYAGASQDWGSVYAIRK
jgi:uncharacterized repeat protein (TIGR03803 family)